MNTARWPLPGSAKLAGGLLCACLLAAAGLLAQSTRAGITTRAMTVSSAVSTAAPQLQVSGRGLFSAQGRRVVLHGVNRAGGEFACVQGGGIWDGPRNSGTAMKSWHVQAVRVPRNEACWNADSYVQAQYRGPSYRKAGEA